MKRKHEVRKQDAANKTSKCPDCSNSGTAVILCPTHPLVNRTCYHLKLNGDPDFGFSVNNSYGN